MVGKENPIPAKIVCVRNKANRKDWLAFICTDTSLSEEEIIRIYGKRWDIEVFFKTCKSMLNLIGECHSLSYDALTALVAIVFTRYMLLATGQWQNEEQRTLGELFFFLVDEMDVLMESLQEILKLSDEQLSALLLILNPDCQNICVIHSIQGLRWHKSLYLLAEILNFHGAKPIWSMGSLVKHIPEWGNF